MRILNVFTEFVLSHLVYFIFGGFLLVVYYIKNKRDRQSKIAQKVLDKAVKAQMNEPLTLHPEIDPALCAGCGTCTKVCPEGDILQLINHKAVLVAPTKCVGHGECEAVCPMKAIKLVFGTKTRGMDIPRLTTDYETNVPGLYIAGELGGMGLIRNAIRQGVSAAEHALDNLSSEKFDYELLIVGAGPAGFAASLASIAKKKNYKCIEQSSLGGTVFNFPRQKLVMSHPFTLPIVGTVKFKSNEVQKEELLSEWNKIGKQTGLKVQEETKFEGLDQSGSGFSVKTNKGVITANKVILCMGVRGSPRRLGVPGEDSAKVTYNLIDAQQYQGKHVVVVGGGNAGVEAAQMLGDAKLKNQVKLLVRSATFDRCNEDNQKRINALNGKGHVEIWYNSSVKSIASTEVTIVKEGNEMTIPNDYVFVFAGAELPHKFLMSLGIDIQKKFGQALGA